MNTTEEIKQRLDIVGLISDYVQLTKAGKNFRGLCPFHTEKTPSFFVFPDRQTWRCFGCGAGGDMISFVMKRDGLEFGEALKTLATRAGVTLPEKRVPTPEEKGIPKLYKINEVAANYYHNILLESEAASDARKYVKSRDLSPQTISEFQLGYSLDSWESLKQYLIKQGFKEGELVAAGLAIAKEDRIYDRFRGRLMFPIRDAKGRPIGFGARALDDSMPKYLNSPESPIFSKSSVLYGIDLAKSAIREIGKSVIVEGYMDAITAHQNGFRNVVASMGTALTEKQIAILKGMTSHICLSLDADAAGNAATLRGIEICRHSLSKEIQGKKGWMGKSTVLGANIDIISIPEGKDPDDVIRKDPKEWHELVDNAKPLMDYLFEATAKDFNLSRSEEKSQLVNELLPLIAELDDSAVRESYLTKLSQLTGLTDNILKGKVADILYKRYPKKKTSKKPEISRSTQQTGDKWEEHCLALLLQNPQLKESCGNLSADHFERSENREVFKAFCKDLEGNLDSALYEHLQMLYERQIPTQDRNKQKQDLVDCIRRMEERRLRQKHQMILETAAVEDGTLSEQESKQLTDLQQQRTSSGWR